MKNEEEKENIIENLNNFADEKQVESKLRQSTENNTLTLTKKREREKEKENEDEKNGENKNIFLYSDDEDNSKLDDSSSSESEYIFYQNEYFDKTYGNEEEKLENFYEFETNK